MIILLSTLRIQLAYVTMKGYILSNENKYYERGEVVPSHSWNAFKQRTMQLKL